METLYEQPKTSDEVRTLNSLIQSMDLPINRKDTEKPETLKWLAQNMGVRNSKHKNYLLARALLVTLIRNRRLLKNGEIRNLENQIKGTS